MKISLTPDKYPQIFPAKEIVDSFAYPKTPIKPKKPTDDVGNIPSKYPYLSNNIKYTGISLLVFLTTIGIAQVVYNPLVFIILILSFLCVVFFLL